MPFGTFFGFKFGRANYISVTNYHRSPSHEIYSANSCLVFVLLVRWGDVEGSLSDKFVTNSE